MAEYRNSGHALCDSKYRLVWVTKYRDKLLRGEVAERARDPIRQIGHAREVVIVRGSVSLDPIHMLVSAPAHLASSKLVQYVQGRSSRRLGKNFRACGSVTGRHSWARWTRTRIEAYFENQKWDEDDQGFKITAPTGP